MQNCCSKCQKEKNTPVTCDEFSKLQFGNHRGLAESESESWIYEAHNSWVIHEKRLNVLCKSRCTHTYKRSFDFDLKFETWNHPLSEYKSKIRAWSKHINGQPGLPGDINGPCKDQWPTQCEPKPPLQKKTTPKKQVLGTTRSAPRGGFQFSSRTSILQMQTRLRSCWGWLGSCFGRKAICSWSCPLALWSRGERCRSSKCSCTRFCRACGPTPKTENNRQKTSYWSDLVA